MVLAWWQRHGTEMNRNAASLDLVTLWDLARAKKAGLSRKGLLPTTEAQPKA